MQTKQDDAGGDANPSYISLNTRENLGDEIVPAGLLKKKEIFLFSHFYSRRSKFSDCSTQNICAEWHIQLPNVFSWTYPMGTKEHPLAQCQTGKNKTDVSDISVQVLCEKKSHKQS